MGKDQVPGPEGRLYRFLVEIYGDQPAVTSVEVDVEALSGGAFGTPHLEATEVRVYAGDEQVLPDFASLEYWQALRAKRPDVLEGRLAHQERLDAVLAVIEGEGLYLEYGLDWPDSGVQVISPLRYTIEELRSGGGAV